jgi:hypothetical protein
MGWDGRVGLMAACAYMSMKEKCRQLEAVEDNIKDNLKEISDV